MVRAFAGASPPTTGNADSALNVGLEFYVTSTASLTAIHWWQPTTTTDSSARTAALYDTGATLAAGPVTGSAPSGPGWQTISFTPYSLTVNARYKAVVLHPAGGYAASANYFTALPDIVNGVLTVPGAPNATDNEQGSFKYLGSIDYPDSAFNDTNYWVDVTVTAPGGADPVIMMRPLIIVP